MLSSTIEIRCQFITMLLGENFIRGKTLLELGARHGDCGVFFHELGADVTVLDRSKNLSEAKIKYAKRYPNLKFEECDLNNEFPEGHWDIILNMMTLHHLDDPKFVLREMFTHGDVFVIESRVVNSDDPDFFIETTKTMKKGQKEYSAHKKACTAAFFEREFDECGFKWTRYDDARLNTLFLKYDWQVTETKNMNRGISRLWKVWR